jgi:hypothetical protein
MSKTYFTISGSESRDAQYLFAKISLFIPVLLLIGIINVSVDPQGVYKKKANKYGLEEYHIAQALAAGKDVNLFRDIDDRLLQKYFVEDLTSAPDIVVLGGSQMMWIGNNVFPGSKVINNA